MFLNLNKVRIDLAEEHLSDHTVAISEISYILGFSEACVFHRFFKKHKGDTPQNYRMKTGKLRACLKNNLAKNSVYYDTQRVCGNETEKIELGAYHEKRISYRFDE
jgi:AraC-like DNA-binding protein